MKGLGLGIKTPTWNTSVSTVHSVTTDFNTTTTWNTTKSTTTTWNTSTGTSTTTTSSWNTTQSTTTRIGSEIENRLRNRKYVVYKLKKKKSAPKSPTPIYKKKIGSEIAFTTVLMCVVIYTIIY